MLEREVKLAYSSIHEAQAAVTAAGASLIRPRRLQRDILFDTVEQSLRERGCALRVRDDAGRRVLTFKGPVQPAAMKLRQEHETDVDNRQVLVHAARSARLPSLVHVQKYREEYSLPRSRRRHRRDPGRYFRGARRRTSRAS